MVVFIFRRFLCSFSCRFISSVVWRFNNLCYFLFILAFQVFRLSFCYLFYFRQIYFRELWLLTDRLYMNHNDCPFMHPIRGLFSRSTSLIEPIVYF